MPVLAYKDHFPEMGEEVFVALPNPFKQVGNLLYYNFVILTA